MTMGIFRAVSVYLVGAILIAIWPNRISDGEDEEMWYNLPNNPSADVYDRLWASKPSS